MSNGRRHRRQSDRLRGEEFEAENVAQLLALLEELEAEGAPFVVTTWHRDGECPYCDQ